MASKPTLHIIDGSSRSRAEQARVGFERGYHCEIYSDLSELISSPLDRGVILARDDQSSSSVEQILSSLARNGIWMPVVATSEKPRPRQIVAAIKAGALEYMGLPLRPERLDEAIERILQEAEAYGKARRKMVQARNRLESLSPREREVLDWLAEGCSNKLIARELEISPRTVEVHRANMMSKLGAHHTAEAVRLRIEASLTEDSSRQVA